jgi:histidine ammonia-lyase
MNSNSSPILLDGYSLTLPLAAAIASGASVAIAPDALTRVQRSRALVDQVSRGDRPYYGINTGFGYFANTIVPADQRRQLQENIVRSHAGGHGVPLRIPEVRLALALRLNLLLKGLSGVRVEVCQALHALLAHEIYPVVPEYGSVGASGDLIPLAHLALALLGEGEVWYRGERRPAHEVFDLLGVARLALAEKEGLSLVNGTEIMQAVGGLSLLRAIGLLEAAEKITALTFEALEGIPSVLDPRLHAARGHQGQIRSAATILRELDGSSLVSTPPAGKVQDPYSVRCAPQIHGAARDSFDHCCRILSTELNAVTDNPLVFADESDIVSGGNFHGEPLALIFDFAALALSEIGNVSERRLELLSNPHRSGLAAFGSPDPGLCSGYMVLQYLSACAVNENKVLSHPASTDSIPGIVGVEDHVSMGMTSARKLRSIGDNVARSLAAELLLAAQAIDLRNRPADTLGHGTRRTYEALRATVPSLRNDRFLAPEISEAIAIVDALAHSGRVE